MTGIAMSEKQKWVNLSDGGHIENMGVYELLRRRCKFIISVDGEVRSAVDVSGPISRWCDTPRSISVSASILKLGESAA